MESAASNCPFSPDPTDHALIGIDPGTQTGLAIWRPKIGQFEEIIKMPIHRAMDFVRIIANQAKDDGAIIEVHCENPNTFVPFKGNKTFRATAQGAGSIKRDFKIWKEFCEDYDIPFFPIRLQKERKKMKADEFKELTGWERKTNEHSRDAAMMVFQKNVTPKKKEQDD